MWGIILIIGVFVVFMIGISAVVNKQEGNRKKSKTENNPLPRSTSQPQQYRLVLDTSASNDDDEDTLNTYIAGVNYRCKPDAEFGFVGYTQPEPTNPHDRNAVMVMKNTGEQLGYVPKDLLREYHRDAKGRNCPCVGYVCPGKDGLVYGRVKIIFSTDEDMVTYIAGSYVRWLLNNKGKKFLPYAFNFDNANPKTVHEMTSHITASLEELEEKMRKKGVF